MRAFLGLFALLFLFASAAAWQGRVTRDLRRRQDQAKGLPTERAVRERHAARRETLTAGWNTLLIGRPSGAEPFFDRNPRPAPRVEREDSRERTDDPGDRATDPRDREQPVPPPLPRFEPDFQITVRAGDVLSKICQGHYRSRPDGLSLHDVVGAVSRYNGLSSPDAIRVGDVIRLPDIARFVENE